MFNVMLSVLDIPKIFIQKADASETEKLRRILEEGVLGINENNVRN